MTHAKSIVSLLEAETCPSSRYRHGGLLTFVQKHLGVSFFLTQVFLTISARESHTKEAESKYLKYRGSRPAANRPPYAIQAGQQKSTLKVSFLPHVNPAMRVQSASDWQLAVEELEPPQITRST